MKVRNMTSSRGNKIAKQFIIKGNGSITGTPFETFQSYDSVIATKAFTDEGIIGTLDSNYWDYSVTTGKYRNQFLGETKAATQAKIDSGEYILADLN